MVGYPMGVAAAARDRRGPRRRGRRLGLPAVPRRASRRCSRWCSGGCCRRAVADAAGGGSSPWTVAAQPALLYGYGLWTGVKELAGARCSSRWRRRSPSSAAAMLAFAAGSRSRPRRRRRSASLSVGGAVWLLPLGVWLLVAARPALRVRTSPRRLLCWSLLALPAVAEAGALPRRRAPRARWRDEDRLGEPASAAQPAPGLRGLAGRRLPRTTGRLLADDRRSSRSSPVLAAAGLARSVAAPRRAASVRRLRDRRGRVVVLGVRARRGSRRRRSRSPPRRCSPLAASGCAWLAGIRPPRRAGVAAALVAGGVLWSNVLAYGDVNLAPRDQLAELEGIGRDFAGPGTGADDGVPARRRPPLPPPARCRRRLGAQTPARPAAGRHGRWRSCEYANLDAFRLDGVLAYRTLVLRRSPLESRPPAPYELRAAGPVLRGVAAARRRSARSGEHLPLGDAAHPGVAPVCSQVVQARRSRWDASRRSSRDDPVLVLPVPAPGQTVPFTLQRRRPLLDLAGRLDP